MTATLDIKTVPGYLPGTWTIDPVHSEVGFTVKHMMVSKVRGRFGSFEGEIVTGANPLDSSVKASIKLDSIDTNNAQRDAHLRSPDFFEVDTYPTMTFVSTGVAEDTEGLVLKGDLTLKGVTKEVLLRLESNGFGPDPYGGTRAGFSATTEISRSEFGVNFNAALETGGVVVADKVSIQLEIEAVLK